MSKEAVKNTENDNVAIRVEDVSMRFRMGSDRVNSFREYLTRMTNRSLTYKEFTAVDRVSFTVNRGEVFGIVGSNGSGKSTLLKMIAGVLKPSSGKITTFGKIAPLIELGAGFDPELTGRENIYLNGAVLGYSKEFLDAQYDNIVAFSEVGNFLETPIKNYSSGMVSRIAFAIATAVEPDILIADEILSVGDIRFQKKCLDRIRGLMENGTTILLVSHSVKQVSDICDRAMWIEKAKLMSVGTAKEVCEAYSNVMNDEVTLESWKDSDTPATRGGIVQLMWEKVIREGTMQGAALRQAQGAGMQETNEIRFVDVPPGSRFEAPVRWAVENEITNGVDEHRFGADEVATKEQMRLFLERARDKGYPFTAPEEKEEENRYITRGEVAALIG